MSHNTCNREDLKKLRVSDLKLEAKSRGLSGYSRLRKAELIDLLRPQPRPEIIFIDVVAKKKRKREAEKRKREAEKRKREADRELEIPFIDVVAEKKAKKKRKREAKKRKREAEKKREAENRGRSEIIFIDVVAKKEAKKKRKREAEKRKCEAEKRKRDTDVDIDQLVKDVEEELKRKDNVKRDDVRSSQAFELVETDSALEEHVKVYKIVGDEEAKKETRNLLEKEIKRIKKKKRKVKLGKRKRSLQKILDDKEKERKYPFKAYGPNSFLSEVKPTILTFLRDHPDTKIQMVLKCKMSRTDLQTGKVENNSAYFLSWYEINFQGGDVEDLYKIMTEKVLESLAEYQQKGSNWVFDLIEELLLNVVKYDPLSGSSYIHSRRRSQIKRR